ncbi:RNA-binding protein S4 [Clostridium botulinum A2B3 87]|uniref:RNA-binding S4 domain-containing protein n=1 Tax=Clostridium botulinum TaxID=1491 RepID=UPI0001F84958|nr:RNA-binding S4 domain-containing protein [Clostridium botulinum]KEI95611.1 RNA-binding protein S4 [Clostridium botulinum A2B3 87]NFB17457.1 RNA-binding S4 domain-containing protein [Clostridium botulinum]NFB67780.1 RNA-binding S4 domain-containing protein [Clostridium botulinum]NFB99194.1 RNA-binding S4 domain-containing protein [Clostridium botulinum]NFC46842.1 RNA-binding S4 domain-containing protein [Clostridium botulinum]
MRLDKFLKVSRIIKRRTVAKEACENERVFVNSKTAKPGTEVREGDILEIQYANKTMKYEIISVLEHVKKEDAENMYKII